MDKMKKFLKKVGIYVAISFLFIGIGVLLALLIIRRGIDTGGIAGIDGNLSDIRDGIAEATELNEDARELAENAKSEIDDSTELNQQIGNEINTASGSIDRLTEASNQLAELVSRLQKRAREESA